MTGTVIRAGRRSVVVRLDDGQERDARRAEFSTHRLEVGDRARVVVAGPGVWATAYSIAPAAPAPVKPAEVRPLPSILRRAIEAELQAGDSPFTIATRHGLDVRQVRA